MYYHQQHGQHVQLKHKEVLTTIETYFFLADLQKYIYNPFPGSLSITHTRLTPNY